MIILSSLFHSHASRFQAACRKYGVCDEEIFQTADLFERRNIRQVCLCLYALARTVIFLSSELNGKNLILIFQTQLHPEYQGPKMGPKMATENKRNFSESEIRQLREGQVGLQAGQNKGATQAGHGGMGNTRHM